MAKEIRALEIFFQDSTATYTTGSEVSGGVIILTDNDLKAKSIKLVANGLARCQWIEKRSYTKGFASKLTHKDAEIFIDETIILDRLDAGQLSKGKHTYRFQFRLPPYAPASFEGQHGKVQYWVKVIVERSFVKENIEWHKFFTVKGILDLNGDPDAKQSSENVNSIKPYRVLSDCCLRCGEISASLYVNKRSTVPGNCIDFRATIKNQSRSVIVKRIELKLNQLVTCKADNQIRRQTNLLKIISVNLEIRPQQENSWIEQMSDIPPVVPTHLGAGCKFIDVHYQLLMIVKTKGPSKNLQVPLQIIIGTVPLRRPSHIGPMLTVRGAIARASAGEIDADVLEQLQQREIQLVV